MRMNLEYTTCTQELTEIMMTVALATNLRRERRWSRRILQSQIVSDFLLA